MPRASRARGWLEGGGDTITIVIMRRRRRRRVPLATNGGLWARRHTAPRTRITATTIIGRRPLKEGEWRGGCGDGRASGRSAMELPLGVLSSSSSTIAIGITPPLRLAGHFNTTCSPRSASDAERVDASGGQVQDKRVSSAAAIFNVVPCTSFVVVQTTMGSTSTLVGPTCACGVGRRVQGRPQGSGVPPLHQPSTVSVHGV